MKLLLEDQFEDVISQILQEGANKRYVVEGITVQSEIPNKNKRIYPKAVIKPEIDRYIREEIETNQAVGHLGHPLEDPRNDPTKVSHKFESLTESGNNWIGRAVITTKTPMGSIVAGLMEEGIRLGISSRGLGEFKTSGGLKVVQKYRMLSAGDILFGPSAPDAYLTNLMEGKEWVFANGVLTEQVADEAIDSLNNLAAAKKLNRENMEKIFNYVLSNINAGV